MDINIPGPTKPAYFVNTRFNLVNKLDKLREADKGRAVFVTEVAVVSEQPHPFLMRVAVEVIDPMRVEGRRAADDPVDLVIPAEELLGKI